jgi:hypothetical protein
MNDEGSTPGRLGLADVLQALGEELREAQQRGGGTIAWMNAEVEMEVAVDTSGSAGVKFWVLNADAARGVTRTTRVKVSLTPHNEFQQPYGVGK